MKIKIKKICKNSFPTRFLVTITGRLLLLCSLIGFVNAHAATAPNTSQTTNEITESKNCCYSSGISYCDQTAGHYVCKDGGYSACICTNAAPVSTYRQLALGCCLWHGGVAASSLGQVVCADGSLSEVCSLQQASNNSGMSTASSF